MLHLRIAIVDDDPVCLDILEMRLIRCGCTNIARFDDPLELLNALRPEALPELIISDFMMPSMNGVELLNTVRQRFGEFKSAILTSDPVAANATPHEFTIIDKGDKNLQNRIRELVADSRQQNGCELTRVRHTQTGDQVRAVIAEVLEIGDDQVGDNQSFTSHQHLSFSERVDILIAVERQLLGTSDGVFPVGADSVNELVQCIEKARFEMIRKALRASLTHYANNARARACC